MARSKFNKNHPELLDGEVFLTNAFGDCKCGWDMMGLRTLRCGLYAYNDNGDRVSGYPVFAMRNELMNKGICISGIDA